MEKEATVDSHRPHGNAIAGGRRCRVRKLIFTFVLKIIHTRPGNVLEKLTQRKHQYLRALHICTHFSILSNTYLDRFDLDNSNQENDLCFFAGLNRNSIFGLDEIKKLK